MAEDKDLETLVQKMIDEGKSEDEISKAVYAFDDNPPDIWARRLNGLMKGLVVDLPSNAYAAFLSVPVAVAKDLYSVLEGQSPEALKTIVEGMSNIGNEFASADPETKARMIGQLVETAGLGAAAAQFGKPAAKATLRGAGTMMKTVGEKGGWPIRMMGAHQLGSGNLLGAAVLAVPEILKSAGTKLRSMGGADLETALPSGTREIPMGKVGAPIHIQPSAADVPPVKEGQVAIMGTPAEASGRVQKVMAKEAKAAETARVKQDKLDIENAKLDKLTAATEGKELRQGPVRQTTTAKTPGGIRLSQTETFANPKKGVEPGTGASEIGAETTIEQAARMLGDRRAELSPSALRQGRPAVNIEPGATETTPAALPPRPGEQFVQGVSSERLVPPIPKTAIDVLGPPKGDLGELGGAAGGQFPPTRPLNRPPTPPTEPRMPPGISITGLEGGADVRPGEPTPPPSAGTKLAPGKLDPKTTEFLADIKPTENDIEVFKMARGRGLDEATAKKYTLFQRAQRNELYSTGTTDPLAAEAMKQEMGL
jgi:hypothetical protein